MKLIKNKKCHFSVFSIVGIIFIIGAIYVFIMGIPNDLDALECGKDYPYETENTKLMHWKEGNKCCMYVLYDEKITVNCRNG